MKPKVYLVTYDYDGPTEELESLFEVLKSFKSWWHFIDGSWLITVEDMDANAIYQQIKQVIPDGLNVLVIETGNDRQGWLPKKAWPWIKKNIPKQLA